MNLLIDANISWRIVKILGSVFNAIHVEQTTLPIPATDKEIWDYALQNDMIIVTNDEDFLNFSLNYSFPPKVILLRLGNQTTQNIADVLVHHKTSIISLNDTDSIGILEIFG
ncbi:MAG: DUF5615 family PIN-like protein [Candidatus Kapaibacterium sp.]